MTSTSQDPHANWEGGRVGRSRLRLEDDALLRGAGRFIDDIDLGASVLHAAFVRSPHARARINGIDARGTTSLPSVVAVWTAADIAGRIRPIAADFAVPGFKVVTRLALAQDQVSFVGEAVALVIASDPYDAADAVESVDADYEIMPAIIQAQAALDAPAIHDGVADNVLFESAFLSTGFPGNREPAAIRLTERFTAARIAAVSIEARGCAASFDRHSGLLTVWSSTQVPHILHACISEHLGIRHSDVRVITPDVGGGFGVKAVVYPEELLIAAAALDLGRPVKWIQDRYDDLLTSTHARDHSYDVAFSFNDKGRLLSLEADILVNIGAYPMLPFGSSLEANGAPRNLPGAYDLQNFKFRVRAVTTNTCPTGAYRGVSTPLSCFVMEGIMDRIARHLGIDPLEVRRRNLVHRFPHQNVLGQNYADGCYLPSLEQAARTIDYQGLRQRQQTADGKVAFAYGIGLSVITEQTGMASARYRARGAYRIPGYEAVTVKVDHDGTVTGAVSLSAQGQGHQTVFSQILSDRLGVPIDSIKIIEGDTGLTPFGSGTFASRGIVLAGSAFERAALRIREKMATIAAQHLECSAHDLVFAGGRISVKGVAALGMSIKEVAAIAYSRDARPLPAGMEFGLEAAESSDPPSPMIGSAVHIASVAIEKSTGRVDIDNYVVVHDCGVMINPALVDGQVHGGVVQGIGEVLMENYEYDASGQPLSVSLMDYQIPRSCNLQTIQVDECHQDESPAYFKGVGESGTIGAVPAVANAIGDALKSYGANINTLPMTAAAIRRIIAQGSADEP